METMTLEIPSAEEYQQAISNHLSIKQIEILQTLYHSPNCSATAKELATALNYASYHAANRQVGEIGKVISTSTNIVPPISPFSRNGAKPAYWLLIGEYYPNTGWEMWPTLQEALKNLSLALPNEDDYIEPLPTELFDYDASQVHTEGKVAVVQVNRFERNRKARSACIQHHGDKCAACGFDFEAAYGDLAKGFIHVHHIKPLAETPGEYEVDPVSDLIPLCANCHSVVHLAKPALTTEELKARIDRRRRERVSA